MIFKKDIRYMVTKTKIQKTLIHRTKIHSRCDDIYLPVAKTHRKKHIIKAPSLNSLSFFSRLINQRDQVPYFQQIALIEKF